VRITGRLPGSAVTSFDGAQVDIRTGLVRIELTFSGGDEPEFTEASVVGPGCRVTTTDVSGVGPVVDELHDVGVRVEARTDTEVEVTLGHGIEATIPKNGTISLSAAVEGPPETPVLAAALEVNVDGSGIGVRHSQARWLDSIARIRISRVSLHPDGQVEFDGGGTGVMDWAVNDGLRRASSRITELVKASPRFERLRSFLRVHPG